MDYLKIPCDTCGKLIIVGDDVGRVACGACVNQEVTRIDDEETRWLETYTPEVIKEFRIANKLTQEGLAIKAKVSLSELRQTEQGRRLCPMALALYINSH